MSDAHKADMKVNFDNADTSGDGTLSIQEVSAVMRGCGSKMTDAELAKMFVHDDTDGDRKISFDEFWDSINKRDPNEVKEEELRMLFKKFDKDNSNSLSVSDMKPLFGGRLDDDKLEIVIQKVDADGNSEVSFEEFVKMWKDGL